MMHSAYIWDYFQLKHKNIHLDGLDISDKYTNSIIKKPFPSHKINIVSYAVRKVENLFTWCEHERYTMTMTNKN